jgi:hypothetical protein
VRLVCGSNGVKAVDALQRSQRIGTVQLLLTFDGLDLGQDFHCDSLSNAEDRARLRGEPAPGNSKQCPRFHAEFSPGFA